MQQSLGTTELQCVQHSLEGKYCTPWLMLFSPTAPTLSPPSPFPMPTRLTDADKKRLWEKRYYCHSEVSSLPLVLASAPSWEWACLPDIYALLKQWTHMNHQDALGLLHAT